MSDIAMCRSKTCPLRYTCYRAQAEPNPYRQSYADFDPKNCDAYWKMEPVNGKDITNPE